MTASSQAPSGEGLIGVEEVADAIEGADGVRLRSNKSAGLRYEIVDVNQEPIAVLAAFADHAEAQSQMYHMGRVLKARAAISAHLEALRAAGYVVVSRGLVDAARELIVGEQPLPRPTIEELEAIMAGDGGKVRVAPSGEIFVRPTFDRLERALAEIPNSSEGSRSTEGET